MAESILFYRSSSYFANILWEFQRLRRDVGVPPYVGTRSSCRRGEISIESQGLHVEERINLLAHLPPKWRLANARPEPDFR